MKEAKRKSSGLAKDKPQTKSKANLSIALFDHNTNHREQRDDTATTTNSNASHEPRTAKNIEK